jgi:hypothetical protein
MFDRRWLNTSQTFLFLLHSPSSLLDGGDFPHPTPAVPFSATMYYCSATVAMATEAILTYLDNKLAAESTQAVEW